MKVRKVTILSRGQALGFTSFLGTEATEPETKEKVQASLDIAMGGRVAEEMFYGTDNINTGCTADLRSASKLVYDHLRGGMFQDLTGVANTREIKVLGAEYENQLDLSAQTLLTASYNRTAKKLQPYRQLIDTLSEELVRKETMTDVELRDWLQRYYADSPSTFKLFVGL
jgi:ATP-dependent metalloprotease